MTEQEIVKYKKEIDAMSQYEMAKLWRFAPSGNIYFMNPLADYFKKSFKEKGGMTPEISKEIGW